MTRRRTRAAADGVDDGCTKVHNGPSTITKRRSHGRAAAALLLLAGAAAVSWAVTTGALRLPVGDVISRAALKSEVAKQIASLKPALKAELKNELTEELSASGALVADAGPEPGPVRWIAEAFSFYRGQTVLLEETLRDTIGGAKAALLEGTLDEGPVWDIGYTSKKRCTDIEGQTKAGQRSCCIPRLQTLTWKDSLAEALVKQFGPQRAFNITPPSFLIPEQLTEWRNWAKNNEAPGTAWVLKELRHGKVGVTILPFEEATVAAEERGDDDDDEEEDGGGEPGHRYRVAQRYLKDTMLSSALGGDCALRAWVLVTHVDPLRAYLFDGGIFESNTKHLTYWQAANEGVLGKVGEKTGDDKSKEQHTALGADNEKPTPWALARLRKFIGDATGSPKTFDKLWSDLRNITADMFLAGSNAANCNLKHSGWRCGEYAYSPGDWELFGIDFMFDTDFKPWVLEVNASPAIKRRAFWNSDYSSYPPESDYATLGREYDAQNAAVVDAYARLLQETTVRSAWKRPGCTARSCSPYTEGACSPESNECKTEAEMAKKVGFVPLFGDSPSPRPEMAGKELKA